ncbi:hypothetical protein OEZ86_003941 [Tetradesmus obliquus]|nr:hypothetical protein OEZ86_003941 [Tetradesmus obliquus]
MPPRPVEPAESLLTKRLGSYTHEYTERDLSLYALGLGCGVDDLKYVYECHADFAALPTFGVIPAHPVAMFAPLEHYIPNYDRGKALHGEQYIELLEGLPTAATVVTTAQVLDVQDKGKGAVVVLRTTTVDTQTGKQLALNEFTTFVLGSGRFEGVKQPLPRAAAAVAANAPPDQPPHVVREVATHKDQAALYRLSGDYNPLHIDPGVSSRVGYPQPILHGLATMGISVRQLLAVYGGDQPDSIANIKVRFAKHVFPGETLLVEMWAVSPSKVVFQTRVKERDAVAISNAAVEFRPGRMRQPAHEAAGSLSKL